MRIKDEIAGFRECLDRLTREDRGKAAPDICSSRASVRSRANRHAPRPLTACVISESMSWSSRSIHRKALAGVSINYDLPNRSYARPAAARANPGVNIKYSQIYLIISM
jgi:hypothetical protein